MRNVVILGGGYGGFEVLNGLLGRTLPEDVQLTVIDKNPYHSLKTEFFTIAAGTSAERNIRMDLPDNDRVKYVFARVASIDTQTRSITFHDKNDPVFYDFLIIGVGSEDNYHGVNGAPEYTESVQSFSAARHTAMSVGNMKAYGKLTIVGAGLSGIEAAAEIRESRPDLNIRLLDRGGSVLRAFDPRIQAHVADWFLKNGVEVLHHANVEYVEKDGVCNNGLCYVNDVTIWTAGVQPHHLVRELPYDKDNQTKIMLNDFYQVPNDPNVYVVGDCASSEFSPSGQLAGAQGEAITDVLCSVLNDKNPRIPKEPKLKGTLGSLGSSDGFGNMFQQAFTGWLPRVAKSGVLWLHKRH